MLIATQSICFKIYLDDYLFRKKKKDIIISYKFPHINIYDYSFPEDLLKYKQIFRL